VNALTPPESRRTRAVFICPLDDLIEGAGAAARIDSLQVALFYLGHDATQPRVYAIGNHDPIGDAPVLSRGIVCDVQGEPMVASPLYKQHFSLITGRCLEDETVSVPVYRTLVSDGQVYLVR